MDEVEIDDTGGLRIGPYEFDRADYDDFGDIGYVRRRGGEHVEGFHDTPEGHALFALLGEDNEVDERASSLARM